MTFLVSKEHRAIIVPGDESFPVRIPTARPLDIDGKRLWAVPFNVREAIQLRHIGIPVPSPIGTYYDWPRDISKIPAPFANQIETSAFCTLNHRAYVLNEIGTGKSVAALWAADYLMRVGMIRKALILSPLSTLDRVWSDEVFNHFGHRSIAVLHGTAEKRKRLFANNAFDFYVINHDAVDIIAEMIYKQVKGQKKLVDARFLRDDIDLVIIDELAVYRNSQTNRWRILNKLIKPAMWVWGLTGTPTPNSPADAYGQVKLVTPDRAPEYFSAFRQQVMQQMTEYIWVPRRESAKIVHQVMQPAVRFERDQCFDLPPCMYVTRECELTAEQKRHYKEISKELFTEIQGGKVTAVNEGVKAGKLLQVASGCVYDKDGVVRDVDAAPRVQLLREIIEQATNKVIVFVPFRAPLEMLYREMGKDFKCAMVHGGVSKSQRATIFLEFQKNPELRVLLADAGTMSHGLTLTEANTIVWYGPEWSNDIYEQANGRITRSGQKNNQYIIHIAGTEIERRIYARLRERGRTQGVLLAMAKEGTLG